MRIIRTQVNNVMDWLWTLSCHQLVLTVLLSWRLWGALGLWKYLLSLNRSPF